MVHRMKDLLTQQSKLAVRIVTSVLKTMRRLCARQMRMPVGIDMCRRPAKEPFELVELTIKLTPRCIQVRRIKLSLTFAPHIPVQTNRQFRIVLRELDGFACCSPVDRRT